MNYKIFTQKVNEIIEKMTKEELMDCFHNIARKTSENERTTFLEMIKQCSKDEQKFDKDKRVKISRLMDDSQVKNKLIEIKDTFKKIENEELCLSVQGYEDYSGDYGYGEWINEYTDNEDIGNFINKTIIFAHDCINDFRYKESVEIYDLVLKCVVYAIDEYGGDISRLEFEELVSEDLISVNLKTLALDILYSNYQLKSGKQRINDFYQFFLNKFFSEICVEEIFSRGREDLKDVEQFGEEWITFLMEKEGNIASRLLKESLMYYKGKSGLVEIARISYINHPSLYLEVLIEYEKNHEYHKMQEFGIEALDKIDRNLKIRSEIAIKTAQASQCIQDIQTMTKCWFEVFYSNSTVSNYLRLYVDVNVTKKYKELAEKRIKSLTRSKVRDYEHIKSCLDLNIISESDKKILGFFTGQFNEIKSCYEKTETPLGWSDYFIENILKLMLLYLFSGKSLGKACKIISKKISDSFDFYKPKNLLFFKENWVFESDITESQNENIFWNIFSCWKLNYPISSNDVSKNISWIEQIISKRVETIVGGQHRSQYYDVALLVVALGEVEESNGIEITKKNIIEKYRKKYPRHSSFHGALRECQ